jgi:hypothetical protein
MSARAATEAGAVAPGREVCCALPPVSSRVLLQLCVCLCARVCVCACARACVYVCVMMLPPWLWSGLRGSGMRRACVFGWW